MNYHRHTSLVLLLLAFSGLSLAGAATLTVTNTDDSGPGSLRQAITDANAMAGADTIAFNIPGTGQKTITVLSDLPAITESVIIDGGNGGVASNRVELTGAGALATGLSLPGGPSNNEIRNLVINGFTSRQILFITVTNSTIQGNFLGLNAAGTAIVSGSGTGIEMCCGSSGILIGGTDAAARNVISSATGSGVSIDGSSAVIQGNFIGLDASGTARVGGVFSTGVSINNASATIGGTNPGEGNVIAAFNGIVFGGNPALTQSKGTVEGNFIGTDVTGTMALNLGTGIGVFVDHATGVLINGGNVISGNGTGILIHSSGVSGASSDLTTVQGNFVGTAADGVTPVGNSGNGVDMFLTPNNTIGGTNGGEGNVIAFNGDVGVRNSLSAGNRIEGNSVFKNGALGIDQETPGVSLNDAGDADAAQNFPVITGLTIASGNATITGTFNSKASKTYRLEFFVSPAVDPSGYGEGQTFLGFKDVTTDGSGNASFNVTFPVAGTSTAFTVTATDPDGNTSEFSAAFTTKLLNISTRMRVLTDDNVLIGGFIVTGISPKKVIVRAIGPSLGGLGVQGALADPTLDLNFPDGSVITNDNWKDTQQAEIEATTIPPTDDRESAMVQTLVPGNYTAIVRGKNLTTGIGLVEAYDLDQPADSRLANISTRGFVDTADNVMIGGFIIGPPSLGDATVLVRAIGPSLANSNPPVTGALQDPTLELHDVNGVLLTSNDNWKDSQQLEIEATTIPPTDDRESALIRTLAPGNYTAIVRGKADTTGVGLVEVYHLQ